MGFGDIRSRILAQVNEARSIDWRATILSKADQTVRAVTAGLSIAELRAIFRGEPPTEKPNPRYRVHTKSFWFHIRPRYYQRGSTWFTHTFALGWLSVFFFIVEGITGVVLMIFYTPSPLRAYADMLNILSNVPFGRLLRDIHRLAAEGMVISVFLHMLRVYLTGSYKHSRQFTWLTGVVLLLITLFLSFSGYLLPWDQLAYWAVTIGTSMAEAAPLFGEQLNLLLRGAPDIGAGGLLRFYLLHVIFLPILAIILIGVHYYKVAREHGISLPAGVEEGEVSPEKRAAALERVDLIPDLLTREVMWAAIATFVLVAATAFFWHAPLEHHADIFKTPFHTTAPWYFLWLQGLLKVGDKTLMGVIVPTLVFALLFAIPYIDRNPSRLGRNRKVAITLGLLAVVALVVLTYMGTPRFGVTAPPAVEIAQEFIPEERVGPVRQIPFDQLAGGPYDTETFVLPASPSRLEQVFAAFKARVEDQRELPEGQGVMVIEDWQEGLKKITLRITWKKPDKEERESFEKSVYVHRDSGY